MAADPVGILAFRPDETTVPNFNRSRHAPLRYDSKINPSDKIGMRDWIVTFESALPADHSIIVWWARHPNYVHNKLPTIANYKALTHQNPNLKGRVIDDEYAIFSSIFVTLNHIVCGWLITRVEWENDPERRWRAEPYVQLL